MYKERYIERVSESGCWLWLGKMDSGGYGVIRKGPAKEQRSYRAHRLFYEEYVGPIPEGLWVLHRCDVRCCVNPNHLFLGTRADNMNDMYAKGRRNVQGIDNPNYRHGRYIRDL